VNLVALIGNVATDPDLRHTSNGKAVCTFRIAVSRPGSDAADFVTVVAWERQAEVSKEFLTIGRRVAIDGRIHQSTWKTEAGPRSAIEIVAQRVHLLGGPRTSQRPAQQAAPQQASVETSETAREHQELQEPAVV
jgi:single-strand DNA-binding protein